MGALIRVILNEALGHVTLNEALGHVILNEAQRSEESHAASHNDVTRFLATLGMTVCFQAISRPSMQIHSSDNTNH